MLEVYSRSLSNAKKLTAKLYNAMATNKLDFSQSKAEVLFICVPDDAIEQVAAELKLPSGCLVVHTSGTKPLAILDIIKGVKIGVFYPLQTFTKAKAVNFEKVPICLEANEKALEKVMEKLAFTICENVAFVNSNDRKVLHLAAVFACNFANHLFTMAKNILKQEDLDFKILQPLIEETVQKAFANGPEKSQSGPAARNDIKTIEAHLKMLHSSSLMQSIYQNMTDSIQDSHYLGKK